MADVLLSFDCPDCGNDENYVLVRTFVEHQGLPVVSADTVSQVEIACTDEDCDCVFVTSDLSEITFDKEDL